MSEFRKQFDAAKTDYQSAKYPGDLAADLFRSQRSSGRAVLFRIGFAVAAAACVTIAVGVWRANRSTATDPTKVVVINPPSTSQPVQLAINTPDDTDLTAPLPASQELPADTSSFPTALPAMPSDSQSSFPSAMSMPTYDSTSSDTTSSERERT